jgi:hypothetical protein
MFADSSASGSDRLVGFASRVLRTRVVQLLQSIGAMPRHRQFGQSPLLLPVITLHRRVVMQPRLWTGSSTPVRLFTLYIPASNVNCVEAASNLPIPHCRTMTRLFDMGYSDGSNRSTFERLYSGNPICRIRFHLEVDMRFGLFRSGAPLGS